MAALQEFTLTCRGERYSLFPDMKVIRNSITFAPLVHKLRNGKCAHHLLKGFLMVPKVKQEAPWFRRVYGMGTSKQTIQIPISIYAYQKYHLLVYDLWYLLNLEGI
jgi:hypothetical protein